MVLVDGWIVAGAPIFEALSASLLPLHETLMIFQLRAVP